METIFKTYLEVIEYEILFSDLGVSDVNTLS